MTVEESEIVPSSENHNCRHEWSIKRMLGFLFCGTHFRSSESLVKEEAFKDIFNQDFKILSNQRYISKLRCFELQLHVSFYLHEQWSVFEKKLLFRSTILLFIVDPNNIFFSKTDHCSDNKMKYEAQP